MFMVIGAAQAVLALEEAYRNEPKRLFNDCLRGYTLFGYISPADATRFDTHSEHISMDSTQWNAYHNYLYLKDVTQVGTIVNKDEMYVTSHEEYL